MEKLDRPEELERIDRSGMLRALRLFPASCREAVETARHLQLDAIPRDFRAIVFVGVGGSAISGHIIVDWLLDDLPIPLFVSRGWDLPGFVDSRTLVFAISYSGNTEETLAAFLKAANRGCPMIALTSGGELGRIAAERGVPWLALPRGKQPRASLPDQLFSLATILQRLGLAGLWGEVDEAVDVVAEMADQLAPEVPTASNPAKGVALGLAGMVPFIYGPRLFDGVAYRIRTQLNENAKVPSGSGAFPEAFHNAVMASEGPEEVRRRACALVIRDPMEPPALARRIEVFEALLKVRLGGVLEIRARGRGKLPRMLSALYVGDYAATYLGLLYGLDPSSTASIEALRRASGLQHL